MPLSRSFPAFIFLFVLMFAGCSSSRPVMDREANLPSGFPNHSYEDIVEKLEHKPFSIDNYHSESALAVRSPMQSGSFSAEIGHKKNDSLLISISPGLGIVAVRALVTPDSFYVHDRINKELAIGTTDAMQRLLPLPSNPAELYEAMLGVWLPPSASNWELSADKSYYILKEPNNRRTIFIDPIFWRVVRYVENNAAGELVEERTFAEFEEYDGYYLPRRLTFRRPGDDTSASLYHRKLTLNPSELDLDLNVSKSIKRIYF